MRLIVRVLFLILVMFLYLLLDLVPLSGSLKRPVSTLPMPNHLRALHSPLSSGLNPEGIYVWDGSAVEATHLAPVPTASFTPEQFCKLIF